MKLLNFLTIFIFVLTLFVFVSPLPTFAQQQPLVPCGGPGQPACTFCHLMELANRVVDFGIKMIILPLAAVGILAAGLVLLTAGGSQSRLEMGRSMLWNILIGFFIAVSAWLIINAILGTLVQDSLFNPLTSPFPACR